MLYWLCELAGHNPTYKNDYRYINYLKAIRKEYYTGDDHRLPFKLKHIINYVKAYAKRPHLSYDKTIDICLVLLFFFTMARPAEFLLSKHDHKRLSGLKLRNFLRVYDQENKMKLIRLTVEAYKNQAYRKVAKHIYLATLKCKNHINCSCRNIDPYTSILSVLRKRNSLLTKLKNDLQNCSSVPSSQLSERIQALEFQPQNSLFVYSSGRSASTRDLDRIVKEIVWVNKIMAKEHYTSYSLRIGGTTHASMIGIDHPKILKYVGWANSRLADCAQRYIRYSPHELAIISFEMVHGPRTKNVKKPDNKFFDPWNNKINWKPYKK